MQIIRYLTLLCIFGTISTIGILISRRFSDRLVELQNFKNALTIFKAKIKFTYETIPEIFNEISRKINGNIGELFKKVVIKMKSNTAEESWIYAINHTNTNLNNEDKEILKSLGKLLGKTDIEGQISQIELTSSFLDTQIENAKLEKCKNGKMYKTLRLCCGTGYCYCISIITSLFLVLT